MKNYLIGQHQTILFIKNILKDNYLRLTGLIFFQFLSAICPLIVAWFISKLINELVVINGLSFNLFDSKFIIILVAFCIIFLLLDEIFTVVSQFFTDVFEDLINKKIKFLILEKVSEYPTNDLFESPKVSNLITLVKSNIKVICSSVNTFSQFLNGVFSLVPSIIVAYAFKWWIALLLLLTLSPLIYVRIKIQEQTWNTKKNFSDVLQTLDTYEKCLTSAHFAQDIRLYSMQPHLLKTWSETFLSYFNQVNNIRKNGTIIISLWALVSGIGIGITFLYIINSAIQGIFTIGDLSFLFGVIIQLRKGIANVVYGASEIASTLFAFGPLIEILTIPKIQLIKEHNFVACIKKTPILLQCKNVTYHYHECNVPVLDNINFDLKQGESIAIVGENGSGKTTLIKLICRLHQVSSGDILWKEQNINTYNFSEYRSKISAIFQNFAKFPLSVSQNIDVRGLDKSDSELQEALEQVGLSSLLNNKLKRVLERIRKNGIDLSGGQWQRLALARILIYLNDSPTELLIFDEPTSALDPNSEYYIMNLIRKMITKKTSIIISHRLALTQFVDRILVMAHGQIIETGTHSYLMSLKGHYYGMFNKQASYYKEK